MARAVCVLRELFGSSFRLFALADRLIVLVPDGDAGVAEDDGEHEAGVAQHRPGQVGQCRHTRVCHLVKT